MGDEIPCTSGVDGCPSDGRWQYNTDVVFSETGTVSPHHSLPLFSFFVSLFAPSTPLIISSHSFISPSCYTIDPSLIKLRYLPNTINHTCITSLSLINRLRIQRISLPLSALLLVFLSVLISCSPTLRYHSHLVPPFLSFPFLSFPFLSFLVLCSLFFLPFLFCSTSPSFLYIYFIYYFYLFIYLFIYAEYLFYVQLLYSDSNITNMISL